MVASGVEDRSGAGYEIKPFHHREQRRNLLFFFRDPRLRIYFFCWLCYPASAG